MAKRIVGVAVVGGAVALGIGMGRPRSLAGGAYAMSVLGYEVAVRFDVSRSSAEQQPERHTKTGWPGCVATVDTLFVHAGPSEGSP